MMRFELESHSQAANYTPTIMTTGALHNTINQKKMCVVLYTMSFHDVFDINFSSSDIHFGCCC